MAQVARAQTEAGGRPASAARLAVQFRGMGLPEQEITISSTVREERDGELVIACDAEQDGKRIIRNGEAEPVRATVAAGRLIDSMGC